MDIISSQPCGESNILTETIGPRDLSGSYRGWVARMTWTHDDEHRAVGQARGPHRMFSRQSGMLITINNCLIDLLVRCLCQDVGFTSRVEKRFNIHSILLPGVPLSDQIIERGLNCFSAEQLDNFALGRDLEQ